MDPQKRNQRQQEIGVILLKQHRHESLAHGGQWEGGFDDIREPFAIDKNSLRKERTE